jgi:hypothetical protein
MADDGDLVSLRLVSFGAEPDDVGADRHLQRETHRRAALAAASSDTSELDVIERYIHRWRALDLDHDLTDQFLALADLVLDIGLLLSAASVGVLVQISPEHGQGFGIAMELEEAEGLVEHRPGSLPAS